MQNNTTRANGGLGNGHHNPFFLDDGGFGGPFDAYANPLAWAGPPNSAANDEILL